MPFDHIQPNDSIKECREKDLTYAAPLTMEVAFVNRETGEIREQKVFMGDLPLMTDWGTYIINGTERVVVTQLVRSPGAYVMEPKDREKQVFIANLMPSRGSWVELEIDKKGLVHVRIDRKRKLPVTTLLFALGLHARRRRQPVPPPRRTPTGSTRSSRRPSTRTPPRASRRPATARASSEIDGDRRRDPQARPRAWTTRPPRSARRRRGRDREAREEARRRARATIMQHALIEVFKKQRPGEPPTVDNSRAARAVAVLRPQALRPHQGRPLQARRAPRPRRCRLERAHAHQPPLHRRASPA